MARHSMALSWMVWRGTVRDGMVRHGTDWDGKARHGTVWHGTVWVAKVRRGTGTVGVAIGHPCLT
jgi:hypothetical protein